MCTTWYTSYSNIVSIVTINKFKCDCHSDHKQNCLIFYTLSLSKPLVNIIEYKCLIRKLLQFGLAVKHFLVYNRLSSSSCFTLWQFWSLWDFRFIKQKSVTSFFFPLRWVHRIPYKTNFVHMRSQSTNICAVTRAKIISYHNIIHVNIATLTTPQRVLQLQNHYSTC